MRVPALLLSATAWSLLICSLAPSTGARDSDDNVARAESVKLVDLLSASTNHTLLLSAFQRARLIPTLNRLNGSTLWAPTNDAIEREARNERASATLEPHVWSFIAETGADLSKDPPDNLQLALRDTLLYHVINYTLFEAPPTTKSSSSDAHSFQHERLPLQMPTLQETLLHPSLSPYNKSFPAPPSLPGSPRDHKDPDRPHKVEGLLRRQGQQLRVTLQTIEGNATDVSVGTDANGKGGATSLGAIQYAANGALVTIDAVLRKPKDIASLIKELPELSTLASLLPEDILNYASTAPHLTVFAPTNEAWDELSELELRYLRSGFAEDDLAEIFGDATSRIGAGKGKVGYIPSLLGKNGNNTAEVTTWWNETLIVEGGKDGRNATVNGTAIVTGDILAMNGVIHTVPKLLLPSGSLSLTAEKYLLALNCTRFVSLLRSVNLSHYVQIPVEAASLAPVSPMVAPARLQVHLFDATSTTESESYTILAPRDDVFDSHWITNGQPISAKGSSSLPSPGSRALKELLEYHIVKGKWTVEELEDGMLVSTVLKGEQLKGDSQRLPVSVSDNDLPDDDDDSDDDDDGGLFGKGWWRSSKRKDEKKPKTGVVGFGGASVVADPVVVGNTIIYLISSVLEPPQPVIVEAVADLRLSTFVASVYAASMDSILNKQPGVTFLVPSNQAFASLGLVMSFLLLPSARNELRSVVKYHAIDEVVYLDDFAPGGAHRYPTLDSAEIYVERDNQTLYVHGPTSGGLPANGEVRDARVIEGNILTATGAIHIIDQVELPPELDISISKLLQGARANTFVDLIRAANFSWVINGAPPPNSFSHLKGMRTTRHWTKDTAYTILCPTDKALSRINLTHYYAHPDELVYLVRLHIIPTNAFTPLGPDGLPLSITNEVVYSTLQDKSNGGPSDYGKVAFRRWGGEGWLVGIKAARGTRGQTDSARVISFGRASPALVDKRLDAFAPRLAAGGGVLLIDSVLIPYEPSWWRRHWYVWVALFAVVVAVGVGTLVWMSWKRSKDKARYEQLVSENEEDA
ncbi:hypothetical protein OIV83_000147 [Microbotryomycetes sp. JL201]|nr:hypothetical protein OIV83_000147 [Microbotryomycetes sp. JL201]